jgi:hypothetical protein
MIHIGKKMNKLRQLYDNLWFAEETLSNILSDLKSNQPHLVQYAILQIEEAEKQLELNRVYEFEVGLDE